jgi:hypothetical protein
VETPSNAKRAGALPRCCKTHRRVAVFRYGGALEYVPEALKTPKLCSAALEQEGEALECVPEALREQVRAALKKRKQNAY